MMTPAQPGMDAVQTPTTFPPLTALAVAGRKAVRACRRTGRPGLAAIHGVIDDWTDLTPSRRRDLRTAITMLASASGRDLAAIPFTAVEVRRILGTTTPAACGVSEATFKAYRGWIGHILKRLGLMEERRRAAAELMPAWAPLLEALGDDSAWIRLRAFLRFCSARGAGPEAVNDVVLVAYLEHLQACDICGTARGTVRRVALAWNRATEVAPGWPATRLSAPAGEPRQYSLPFESYPASLQEDVAAFRQRLAGGDGQSLYGDGQEDGDDAGAPKPLRPASIATRMDAVRMLLAAAVHSGVPVARITSLAVLVERATVKAILDWHWRRAGRRTTDHTGVLSDTLRVIAKYHVRLDRDELAKLFPLLRRAKPRKRTVMTDKNSRLLRELEDPVRRAQILHLPRHLMRLAQRERDGWVDPDGTGHRPRPLAAARLAAVAAARPTSALALPPEGAQAEARWSCAAA